MCHMAEGDNALTRSREGRGKDARRSLDARAPWRLRAKGHAIAQDCGSLNKEPANEHACVRGAPISLLDRLRPEGEYGPALAKIESMPRNLSLDIDELRRAYGEGEKPAAVIDLIHGRIAELADPGIFIELVPQAQAEGGLLGAAGGRALRHAALGHPLRRQGQYRCRRPADHGRLSGLFLQAGAPRRRRREAPRGRRDPDRQDQSRPVRDGPRGHAHRLTRCRATRSIRCAFPEARARDRPSRSRRGWRASPSAPTRQARDGSRPPSTTLSASSPPSASYRREASCRLPHSRLRIRLRECGG